MVTAVLMVSGEFEVILFTNLIVSPDFAAARAFSRVSYWVPLISASPPLVTGGLTGALSIGPLVGSSEISRSVLPPLLLPPSRYASSPPNWTPSFTAVGAELEVFPPSSSIAYALPPNRLMHIATRRRMDKNLVTFFMFSVSLYCCFLFSPIYITFGRILHDFPPRSSV